MQEFDKADSMYQQGMTVDPNNANLLVVESSLLLASYSLLHVFPLSRSFRLAHSWLLQVHRGLVALQSKGDVTMAVDLITKALELDEKCEFAYETLGTIEVGLVVIHSAL
jgi:Tfp pilus assembly protein PilF